MKYFASKKGMVKRRFLKWSIGVFSMTWAGVLIAQNKNEAYSELALKSFKFNPEGVELDLPSLVETGNSISFRFAIKAPPRQKIQSVDMVAPENPNPLLMRLKMSSQTEHLRFATRIRLATSQDVWVIATLDNGQKIGKSIPAVITLSACFDAS